MKPVKIFAAAVFLAAGLAVLSAADTQKTAPKKPVFTSYSQPGPLLVVTQDEKAENNVRNQFDFTVPTHGPILTNPEYDSITVMWITRTKCGSGVEYREKGQKDFKRVWDKIYGQIDCDKDLHTLHLTGLKPATEYEYRFVSVIDRAQGYGHGLVFTGREIYSFKTLDPNKKSYQVFYTTDIHGSLRLCLDPMLDRTPAMDSDFFIYLGDNVEDTMGPDPRYHITFGFVDDIVRRYGTNKASVFVRGNHDSTGQRMYDYYRYFPHRTGKGCYSFSQGGVIYVVLETIWHYNDDMMKEYLQEQLEWFRSLKKTDAWKKAEFRVINAHVGTFGNGPRMSPEWVAELNTADPAQRIHLFMTGHHHEYIRIDPNAVESKVGKLPQASLPDVPNTHPYCMIVDESCDSFIMKVEPGKLTLTSYQWHNDPATIRDQFSIAPDGKVTDLVDVKKIPFPEPKAPKGKKK